MKKGWYAHVLGEAPHTFTSAAEAVKTLRVCNKDTLRTMQHRNMQLALQLLVLDLEYSLGAGPRAHGRSTRPLPVTCMCVVDCHMIACCPG